MRFYFQLFTFGTFLLINSSCIRQKVKESKTDFTYHDPLKSSVITDNATKRSFFPGKIEQEDTQKFTGDSAAQVSQDLIQIGSDEIEGKEKKEFPSEISILHVPLKYGKVKNDHEKNKAENHDDREKKLRQGLATVLVSAGLCAIVFALIFFQNIFSNQAVLTIAGGIMAIVEAIVMSQKGKRKNSEQAPVTGQPESNIKQVPALYGYLSLFLGILSVLFLVSGVYCLIYGISGILNQIFTNAILLSIGSAITGITAKNRGENYKPLYVLGIVCGFISGGISTLLSIIYLSPDLF